MPTTMATTSGLHDGPDGQVARDARDRKPEGMHFVDRSGPAMSLSWLTRHLTVSP